MLNKMQVAIIWISLSILLPVSYFAVNEVLSKQFQMNVWDDIKRGDFVFDPAPPEEYSKEWIANGYAENKEKRDKALEDFGIFTFELLSLTGVLVYLTKGNKHSH